MKVLFESKSGLIRPVENINRISISLLKGIDNQKNTFKQHLNFSKI